MTQEFEIRNSTAECLIFQIDGKDNGVRVVYRNEIIWCTQKAMAQLFYCTPDNIGLHVKNIYDTGELVEDSVVSKMKIDELIKFRGFLGS